MDKHAYLIIAHKDDYVFEKLLKALDDPRNDIYIHMDAKNKDYNMTKIEESIHYSKIFHVPRISVSWGGYSLIKAEIILLKSATKRKYGYYHLLSGQDLPIKSQNYIHNFFENNKGCEFVRFQSEKFTYESRVKYYYPLQDTINRKSYFLRAVQKALIFIQKLFHVNRNNSVRFQKGTQWFSIDDDLARYVVSKEDWIKKIFEDTFCCDEVFLQTLVVNSEFKDKLYHKEFDNDCSAIMRLIDWNRGTPYVFRSTDKEELKKSNFLFARKFSADVDKNIIDYVVDNLI